MSEATLFRYPYNLFLMERLEFLLLTEDELEARVLRIIEYEMLKLKEKWQNRVGAALDAKKPIPPEPKEYWVRLSYSQIIAKLYRFDTSRVGAKQALSLSKTSLRRAISGLLKKNLIFMRSVRGDEFGAPQYTLHRQAIQEALDSFPTELDPFSIFYRTPLSDEEDGEAPIWQVGRLQFGRGAFDNWQEGGSNLASGEVPNQNVFKESGKESSKKKEKRVAEEKGTPADSIPPDPAAPAAQNNMFSLSEEEAAIIRALREQKQQASPSSPQASEKEDAPAASLPESEAVPQASEQASAPPSASKPDLAAVQHAGPPDPTHDPAQPAAPPVQELARPASGTLLTDVVIVQLWEWLRKAYYTEAERKGQLAAAQELLQLAPTFPLPLSVDLLEHVYITFFDDFWRKKFRGVMNINHLVQTEKSTGQIRVARWLDILRDHGQGQAQTSPSGAGSAANGISYADLVGMTDEARAALVEAQRERHDQKYEEMGITREALMAMKPEDRIAFVRRHREQQEKLSAAAALAEAV